MADNILIIYYFSPFLFQRDSITLNLRTVINFTGLKKKPQTKTTILIIQVAFVAEIFQLNKSPKDISYKQYK